MKMKKIKYIFELIFIFILPIIFLIPIFSVEKEFEYDNEGNYQVSISHININLDNIYEFNENVFELNYDWLINNQNIYINYNNCIDIENTNFDYLLNTYSHIDKIVYLNDGKELTAIFITDVNDLMFFVDYEIDTIECSDVININNVNYYYYENITNNFYSEDALYNYGYYEIEQIEELTLFGRMKEIIKDNLHIDNIFIDIIIYYNFLWLLMFIIWHLFYLLLDFLLHFWKKEE